MPRFIGPRLSGATPDGPLVAETRARLLAHATPHEIAAGRTIVEPGRPPGSVYFVEQGEARAMIVSGRGLEVWVADYHPGEFFGESAALGAAHDALSVVAAKTCRLAVVPAPIFVDLIAANPDLHLHVSQRLAARLNATTRRMVELSVLSAPARIAAELLRRAQPPEAGEEYQVIRPTPVLSDIARTVITTRETVSRVVSELTRKRIIVRQPGAMIILQPRLLAAYE